MKSGLFLGVDGGGTKTDFVLVDHGGHLVASHQGAGCYHPEIGVEGLREVLRAGLGALLGKAGIGAGAITHAFFGIPAHGEDSALQPLLDAMPDALLGHRRYGCGNDMVCAWAGSLAGADGINVVAGTGSIGYGEYRGRSARAGGWGEVFGDEGSAYWIAVQGLNIFSRMSDGRRPKGVLHSLFKAEFGLDSDLDLSGQMLKAHARGSIASLSRLVTRAAREGDAAAITIFDDAARELAAIALAVRQALECEAERVLSLSYSGGVFAAGALILDPLQRHLGGPASCLRLQVPILTPGAGAAICAARMAGQPLPAASIERLKGRLGIVND